jgi:Uma2 family endonuclease
MKRASRGAIVSTMGPEEFLVWERSQERDRHMYLDGEVFVMHGGTARHSALIARAIVILDGATLQSRCRVFSSDMRVELSNQSFVYPDVVVVCGPVLLRPQTNDVLTNPTLVLEVLSKSTERLDRGKKQDKYLKLPSLRHYVLVSQREPRVEVHTRGKAVEVYEAGACVCLEGIGATFEVDELYRGAFELPGA